MGLSSRSPIPIPQDKQFSDLIRLAWVGLVTKVYLHYTHNKNAPNIQKYQVFNLVKSDYMEHKDDILVFIVFM